MENDILASETFNDGSSYVYDPKFISADLVQLSHQHSQFTEEELNLNTKQMSRTPPRAPRLRPQSIPIKLITTQNRFQLPTA